MKLNYKCLEASDEWGSPVEFSIHKEKETNRVVFFVDVECQDVHLTVKQAKEMITLIYGLTRLRLLLQLCIYCWMIQTSKI